MCCVCVCMKDRVWLGRFTLTLLSLLLLSVVLEQSSQDKRGSVACEGEGGREGGKRGLCASE